MNQYKVIKLPLSNVQTMADRLNETSGQGWELLQMFQTGNDVIAVLKVEFKVELKGNPASVLKKKEVKEVIDLVPEALR